MPAWLPLLLDPGLVNTRAGGDSPFLLQRVHQMSVALQGGHFPVRWMPDAAFGYGYPFWNYYAPLAFYAAAGFHLAGLGFVNAIKLTQILGFLGAGAGMYLLADDVFDSRPAAVLAAAAYTYAPFHLVNVYVRGDSLGEFVAFAFYPLIFLGLRRLRARPGPAPTAFTAVAYTGLVLTHNISALIFTPIALAYALFLLSTNLDAKHQTEEPHHASRITHHASQQRKRFLLWATITFALGLTLSTFYWAPALLEQDAVQLAGNLTGYFHYAGHFRSSNLIQRGLLFNFDVDAAGTPFAMGLIQAILGLLGLLAITISLIRRNSRLAIHNSQFTIHNSLFFAGTALLATFLITPWSKPLWDHIPLLSFVQFPWRWLSVQAFGLSLVIGALGPFLAGVLPPASRLPHPASRWAITASLTLLLITTSMLDLDVAFLPVRDIDVTAERLMLYEMFTGNIGSTVRAEYLPAAVNPRPWSSESLIWGVPAAPIGADAARLMNRGPVSQQWQIAVDQGRDVVFPTFWFPGWRAAIDGQSVEASAQPDYGGIRVRVPAGTHQVTLTLGRTRTRMWAELVSVAGLLLLLGLLVRRGFSAHDVRAGAVLVGGVIVLALVLAGASAIQTARWGEASEGEASRIDGPSGSENDLRLASPLQTAPVQTMDFSHMPYLHPNPAGVSFEDGARLDSYGFSTTEAVAGQAVDLEMVWDEAAPGSEVEVALVSPAEVLYHVPDVIAEARTNLEAQTAVELQVPAETTAGIYLPRLRITNSGQTSPARMPNGAEIDTLYLTPLRIQPRIVNPERTVGQFADLAGVGPVQATQIDPEHLEVRVTWWPLQRIPANYATSIRLKNAAGETIAQEDKQPCYGFCPTSAWEPSVPVYDRRWLSLPADTPPGADYQLEIVLYAAANLAAVDTVQIDNITLSLAED